MAILVNHVRPADGAQCQSRRQEWALMQANSTATKKFVHDGQAMKPSAKQVPIEPSNVYSVSFLR